LLLRAGRGAFSVIDVILTAVLRTLRNTSGVLAFDIMANGRGERDGVSAARTVGRFTTVFPVALTLDTDAALRQQLEATKDQLAAVPHGGFDYGLLRHLSPDRTGAELLRSSAAICFNYAGRFDQVLLTDSPFEGLQEVPRSHRHTMRG